MGNFSVGAQATVLYTKFIIFLEILPCLPGENVLIVCTLGRNVHEY